MSPFPPTLVALQMRIHDQSRSGLKSLQPETLTSIIQIPVAPKDALDNLQPLLTTENDLLFDNLVRQNFDQRYAGTLDPNFAQTHLSQMHFGRH